MCKIVEERAKEYAQTQVNETQIKNIKRMLDSKKLSHTEIADLLNVSIKFVNINYGRFPNSLTPIKKNISKKAISHACTQGIANTFSFEGVSAPLCG